MLKRRFRTTPFLDESRQLLSPRYVRRIATALLGASTTEEMIGLMSAVSTLAPCWSKDVRLVFLDSLKNGVASHIFQKYSYLCMSNPTSTLLETCLMAFGHAIDDARVFEACVVDVVHNPPHEDSMTILASRIDMLMGLPPAILRQLFVWTFELVCKLPAHRRSTGLALLCCLLGMDTAGFLDACHIDDLRTLAKKTLETEDVTSDVLKSVLMVSYMTASSHSLEHALSNFFVDSHQYDIQAP